MFKKEQQQKVQVGANGSTIIAEGALIKGGIDSAGSVIINGKFEGKVVVAQTLTIGKKGEVLGEVKCKNLVVNGLLDGIAYASDVHILEIGQVFGKLEYERLEIDKNGTFEGEGKKKNSSYKIKYNQKISKKKEKEDIIVEG